MCVHAQLRLLTITGAKIISEHKPRLTVTGIAAISIDTRLVAAVVSLTLIYICEWTSIIKTWQLVFSMLVLTLIAYVHPQQLSYMQTLFVSLASPSFKS